MLRLLRSLVVTLLCVTGSACAGEKVADLPTPTHYVNDFAQILSPGGQAKIEDLSLEVHRQANAELFLVTIKTLDDGASKEEFAADLVAKWGIGKKGQDRSALLLMVVSPRGMRVEVGYGLEGILNDAKVGRIMDAAKPDADAGDRDGEAMTVMQGLADVVAADAHATLTPIVHTYHRVDAGPQKIGMGQIVGGVFFVILILILIRTGHIGWAFYLIMSVMGGGRGGGGGRDDDESGGGGFGGLGGGGSGGGGASRDF